MGRRLKKEDPLTYLEQQWPGRQSKEVRQAFRELKKKLVEALSPAIPKTRRPAKSEAATTMTATVGQPADILDLLRKTCTTLDLTFLSRQITYHIAASSGLSYVFVDPEQVQSVFLELLRHAIKRSPHGGRIGISIKEVMLRSGKGVEISFQSIDEKSADVSRTALLGKFFGEQPGGGHSSIFACREVIVKQGGQLTVDVPKPEHVVFRVALPTVVAPVVSGEQHTFKYDITIRNIANVRKRFGIKKSYGLVSQVENYVRSLVRHPIDIVMAVPDKGLITAIYETPKGSAQSVASRISHRLGAEEFRIGKKAVELNFSYQLSALPASSVPRLAKAE